MTFCRDLGCFLRSKLQCCPDVCPNVNCLSVFVACLSPTCQNILFLSMHLSHLIRLYLLLLMLHFGYKILSYRYVRPSLLSYRLSSTNLPMSSTLEQKLSDGLRACGVSEDSSHLLLLSVSGGVDSMCMLHLCGRIKHLYPRADFHVVNFNHKARIESENEVKSFTYLILTLIR